MERVVPFDFIIYISRTKSNIEVLIKITSSHNSNFNRVSTFILSGDPALFYKFYLWTKTILEVGLLAMLA